MLQISKKSLTLYPEESIMYLQLALLVTVLAGLSKQTSANQQPLGWSPIRDTASRPCPCSSPSLCEPITTTARYEVFTFIVSDANYLQYDWRKITTVVMFGSAVSDDIMCYAHSKGVRVSYGAGFPLANLTDAESRSKWVQEQVAYAKDHFMDGINLDFESPIAPWDTAHREGLNMLVSELTAAFKTNFKHPQVTFDASVSPYGSFRYFDYVHIANTTDFMAMMAYDESYVCYAGANSGYYETIKGIKQFIAIGISPKQMVLALPWYGYDYPCYIITKDNACLVWPLCSGGQVGYSKIMNSLIKANTSGRLWDTASLSPFFNYKDSKGGLRQAWYDDAQSLGLKYKWAATTGLRGVGMWTADSIDYSNTTQGQTQRKDMWGALPIVNGRTKSKNGNSYNDIL